MVSCSVTGLEAAYLNEAAADRSLVLLCLFCFDILAYMLRALQLLALGARAVDRKWAAFIPQLVGMAVVWAVIYCIKRRSRKSHGKPWATAQVRSSAQSKCQTIPVPYLLAKLVHVNTC